ncbi:MAG: DUF2934 domain-containing protein [Polyangiaceae bacterium]|nr:DUF2934 domain-containing protein [Polyangiaceae bacterium]
MRTTSPKEEIQDELVAARAYEKWQQRGCPLWESALDWSAARAELEQELETGAAQPPQERKSFTESRPTSEAHAFAH